MAAAIKDGQYATLANGTRLHYEYQAQVGGKVAMVGSRMLEGASRIIIGQLFESLARQVSQNGSGTQTQIEAATRIVRYSDILNPNNTTCPISLTSFNDSDYVTIIRHCGHIFNTTEFNTWFRSNCRCPICRYDIRNYNTNAATSSFFQQEDVSGNSVTSRPSSNTLLERRITETPNERMISNVLQSFLNESSGQIATGNNLTDASGNIAETIGLFRSLFNNNY
jgi:hypothetical protein